MEEESNNTIPVRRPYIISLICVSIAVYAVTVSLVFILAIFFQGWVSRSLDNFFPERNFKPLEILMISIIGLILNILTLIGIIYVWKLRKVGLYLFSIFSLLFISFPFFLGYGSYISLIIMSFMVFIVLLYYRRFY